jgi:hypothetical protein
MRPITTTARAMNMRFLPGHEVALPVLGAQPHAANISCLSYRSM